MSCRFGPAGGPLPAHEIPVDPPRARNQLYLRDRRRGGRIRHPLPCRPFLAIETFVSGDVRITFTGTLTSSGNPQGPYNPVAGNPQGSYTLPAAALGANQYFRAETQ